VRLRLSGLFATHPPIEDRIRRVLPGFEASRYRAGRAQAAPAGDEARRRQAAQAVLETAVLTARGKRASDAAAAWDRSPQASMQLVGTLDAAKVDYAQRLLEKLPQGLREALHTPEGARAAVLALVRPQEGALHIGAQYHLALVDLALPALKRLEQAARAEFLGALEAAILADRRVSLHEFVMLTLLRSQLERAPQRPGRAALAERSAEAIALLSLVALAGGGDAAAAFGAGARQLGFDTAAPLAREALGVDLVRAALEALAGLAPLAKARLVQGLFAAATADGTIRLGEAELLRLVGAVLDCPLPPLVEALDPAALAA
jgi:hypothetical protein